MRIYFRLLQIFFIGFFYSNTNLEAQNFQKITIWERENLETKEVSKRVIEFNEGGQKTLVYQDKNLPLEVYLYDDKGRILSEHIRSEYRDDYTVSYSYQKGLTVIRKAYYRTYNKTIDREVIYQYLNDKGQITESKSYKNIEGVLVMDEWRQFFYDERDSLSLERWVLTEDQKQDYLPTTKIQYAYHSESGRLAEISEYSNERLLSQTTFEYDKDGRLSKQAYENGVYGHSWWFTLFYYKEGVLWRTEKTDIYNKEEKIYQDGKLIRLKVFDNTKFELPLEYVGDYQYDEQ
ncbi:MAG: hypothetical protein ACPG49_11365 [Chitinophagales bacterium]